MKIYLKSDFSTSLSDISGTIKMQVCETIKILKEEYHLEPEYFILDGYVDVNDTALFPMFYQDDKQTITVRDKNDEHTFCLSSPRYTLMYVWEIEDINSPVDSDNVAYQLVSLDKYYRQIQNVNTDGYQFIGRLTQLKMLSKYIQKNMMKDRYDGDKVFFTADTHFGDEFIIKMCNRPWVNTTEMDEALIENWNNTVPNDAVVFHLGDFASNDKQHCADILQRLNGEIHLITGDHDQNYVLKHCSKLLAEITPQKKILVNNQKILLNHYPFLIYSGVHADVWQLFGHVHLRPTATIPTKLQMLFPTQYDVGVDNNNFAPVPFSKIKETIERQCLFNPMEQPAYNEL